MYLINRCYTRWLAAIHTRHKPWGQGCSECIQRPSYLEFFEGDGKPQFTTGLVDLALLLTLRRCVRQKIFAH